MQSMHKRGRIGDVRCLALLCGLAALCQGQSGGRIQSLSPGKILVAAEELPDPNFRQSVVVLVQYGGAGAAGVIVNRPSEITLAKAFPDWKFGERSGDRAYTGGPVERRGVMVIFRSRTQPDALRVTADAYWTTERKQMAKAALAPGAFRLYLGHSGWAPGQLENEVRLGAWHVLPADAAVIFDERPEGLWQRLIERTQLRVATATPPRRLTPE